MDAARVKALGREAGFDDVGIAPPGPHPEMDLAGEWLDAGYHGEMQWMARHRRRRLDPDRTLRGVSAVIVAALDYDTDRPRSTEVAPDPQRGWVSRYAWGQDYHTVIEARLDVWCAAMAAVAPDARFRSYVDHGPVLEKVFGRYAGLGWMGKHTNLIHPRRGSFFFLAVVLTDLTLESDAPIADRCGSCTACLDACPTDAFVAPWILDARRCISYLTIEAKEEPPEALRGGIAPHVYGCDVCQDVCPWNRKPEAPNPAEFQPREGAFRPRLDDLAQLGPASFDERFGGTAIERLGWRALAANASRIEGEG